MDAAGTLNVPLTERKVTDPTTPSPLSVGTPGDRRSLPVENRIKDVLERDQAESGEGENMDKTRVKGQNPCQIVKLDNFKEELWDTVVGFGEPVRMATGLDEEARGELLEKMVHLREQKQSNGAKSCKIALLQMKKLKIRKLGLKLMIRVKLIL